MTGWRLNLAEAARAMAAPVGTGWEETALTGVSTDSRTVAAGELFVALRGEKFDGHRFLDQAFSRGAAAAVVSAGMNQADGRLTLLVPDTLRALGDLASYLRRRQRLEVLALTGSNGKTTTKEMLVRIVGRKYRTLATAGNFNNLVGLPLTLFRLRAEHEACVLEMGMSAPGEIARLTEIADPDVGLVTNVGPAHVAGLGSLEGVARAKGELFQGLSGRAAAAVNLDDPLVVEQAGRFKGRRLTFGFNRRADVRAEMKPSGPGGVIFDLITPAGRARVRLDLLGRHNVANALAAAAAASALGLDPDEIGAALEGFPPFPGRLALRRLPGPVFLLDDTYNANPASTLAALKVLKSLRRKSGRLLAVLGDMLELGPISLEQHARIGRAAAEIGLDILAAVGMEAREMARTAEESPRPPARVAWFAETERAAAWLKNEVKARDRILIKGSRGMRMEKIVHALAGGEGG
ncbi:MAG: UDP-N-acetylmuramoyl-tripeptide--D-alanyl-D-alanine ligase [Thermodesulfobacteriota bacterium]